MHTSISHLPPHRRKQLQTLTHMIAASIRPEKIILFGLHTSSEQGQAAYGTATLPEFLLNYDLLVITRRGDHRYDHEIQDIVERRCHFSTPVNVLVHDIDYVNAQLAAGQYFFSMIHQEAILLYDAGAVPLVEGRRPDMASIRVMAEKDFDNWWQRAGAFFRNALFSLREKEVRIAVFLLHQAAEQAYQAILLAYMGYKPCTHNLDKLRRYTNRFSIELGTLFPRDTPAEDRLFKLLLQSYVDARYKEDFDISGEDLETLTERIERLLSIAARICRNRFISLEKMAS